MFKQKVFIVLILLLIQLPFGAELTEAAFSVPSKMQAYNESYSYSHHGKNALGNGPLITYKQQSFLPIEDVAQILGLHVEKRSGEIHLTGTPMINPSQTVAGALPKDKTISEQIISNAVISAGAGVVLEDQNETPLFAKNAQQRLYPSSTLKIMTALLAIEKGTLTDVVTVSAKAAAVPRDSSKAGILPGDRLTLEQLLYAMMLPSGNDAAVAVAEHIAGSEQQFAKLMNARAKELGATHSNFINAHGYHHSNQYTTATDLAKIAREAATHATFMNITSTPSYYALYRDKNGLPKSKTWKNTNKLIQKNSPYYTSTVVGGKTGYTSASRHNLVSFAKANDHSYVVVLLRGELNPRYVDTRQLLQSITYKRALLDRQNKKVMNVSQVTSKLFVNGEDITPTQSMFTYLGKDYVSVDLLQAASPSISHVKRSDSQQLNATLDSKLLSFDLIGPTINNGRMLVPVRTFFEEAGLQLHFDANSKIIEGRSHDTLITMKLNSKQATVNGQTITLDVPATVQNGRTLVPVRFISESTGKNIDWGRGRTLFLY